MPKLNDGLDDVVEFEKYAVDEADRLWEEGVQILKDTQVCVACGGTGVNSHGGPCSPCIARVAFARLAREREEYAKTPRRREPPIKPLVTPTREPVKPVLPPSAGKLPIRRYLQPDQTRAD